jgi:heptaprenyl diphosphate synthase
VVLLGAFCLFLSTLEYLIPKPLPFMRIGLANLPLMLALDLLSPRYFALLVLIKIAGQGIVGGALFSYVFIFSLAGSLSSALVMYCLRRISGPLGGSAKLSMAGIGVTGAMCSNGIQLLLARFLVFGEGIRYLVPPFLAAGLVTGFALGLFCEHFRTRSRWYKLRGPDAATDTGGPDAGANAPADSPMAESQSRPQLRPQLRTQLRVQKPDAHRKARRAQRRERWSGLFNSGDLIIAGLIAVLLFLLNPSTLGRTAQFLFFWFCAWASGKKNNVWITLSVITGVVVVNLLAPYGKVIAEFGPLHITQGSIITGLRKGITLEGLFMLSGTVIRGNIQKGSQAAAGEIFGRASFGRLLGESLAVFGVISENRGRVRPGHLIDDVDSLLLELDSQTAMAAVTVPVAPGTIEPCPDNVPAPITGSILLVLGLVVTAALMVLPLS